MYGVTFSREGNNLGGIVVSIEESTYETALIEAGRFEGVPAQFRRVRTSVVVDRENVDVWGLRVGRRATGLSPRQCLEIEDLRGDASQGLMPGVRDSCVPRLRICHMRRPHGPRLC